MLVAELNMNKFSANLILTNELIKLDVNYQEITVETSELLC